MDTQTKKKNNGSVFPEVTRTQTLKNKNRRAAPYCEINAARARVAGVVLEDYKKTLFEIDVTQRPLISTVSRRN